MNVLESSSPSHEGEAFLATASAWIASNSSYSFCIFFIWVEILDSNLKRTWGWYSRVQEFYHACKMICNIIYPWLIWGWGSDSLAWWVPTLPNFSWITMGYIMVHQHVRKGSTVRHCHWNSNSLSTLKLQHCAAAIELAATDFNELRQHSQSTRILL